VVPTSAYALRGSVVSRETTNVRLICVSKPVLPEIPDSEALLGYFARVSSAKQEEHETAPRLLKYLKRHEEWSPFEMCSMTMEIHTTRDISRQILRHRSFSFQEFSQRYAEVPDEISPREARMQDRKNRQNSTETDDAVLSNWFHWEQRAVWKHAMTVYKDALHAGVAKEQARALLPEGLTSTKLYMAGTVRSWMHYTDLRCKPETQKEHRLIAEQCREILYTEFPSLR
jgi:thymidylate synthase (FAD)